jgi:hypothetical protein
MSSEDPLSLFDHLGLREVLELKEDVRLYLALEEMALKSLESSAIPLPNPGQSDAKETTAGLETVPFWKALLVVTQDEVDRRERRVKGIPDPRMEKDIHNMLAGKSVQELKILQRQVEERLDSSANASQSGGVVVDVEFWESVLKGLVVYRAKARLREMHAVFVRKRLEDVERRKVEEGEGNGNSGERKVVVEVGKSLLYNASSSRDSENVIEKAMKERKFSLLFFLLHAFKLFLCLCINSSRTNTE